MNGPKHLWSGDWERESAEAEGRRANQPLPVFGQPVAPPATGDPQSRARSARATAAGAGRGSARARSRRQLVVALFVGLAAAVVGIVLAYALGGPPKRTSLQSSSGHSALAPPTQTSPNSQPAQGSQQLQSSIPPQVTGPSADWLGMQIITSPAGVVISTVRLGSPADTAGFEPGDQITAINGHAVSAVDQLRTDTAGLRLGSAVRIDVLRSSAVVTGSVVAMTQRPAIHP